MTHRPLIPLLLACSACATTAPPAATLSPLDLGFDPTTATDITGEPIENLDLDAPERPLLVIFWASWCEPCKREAPALARLATAQRGHLDVLGVSVDTRRAPAQAFSRLYGLPYRSLHDPKLALGDALGIRGTPTLVLIGRDGRVRARARKLTELRGALGEALAASQRVAP